MSPEIKEKLRKAHQAHEAAAKELIRTTAECYPIGQKLAVDLGRARVIGTVTNAGGTCWWYEPDRVTIQNIVTGKRREFPGTDIHDIYHIEFLT